MVKQITSVYLGIRKNKLVEVQDQNIEEIGLDVDSLEEIFRNSSIKFPQKLTPELAEEIGIHIGDGHLSSNRYRYKLFGNQDESEYYKNFLTGLYQRLYNIKVRLEKRVKDGNIIGFEFCSKPVWLFKTKTLGLITGRKDFVLVPQLILNSGPAIWRAFIRGLFDTDGNLYFQTRYGYKNYYPLISLTSKSKELSKITCEMFIKLDFKANYYTTRNGEGVIQLYGYENLLKYAKEIGWHNTKQLNKFLDWKRRFPNLAEKRAASGI